MQPDDASLLLDMLIAARNAVGFVKDINLAGFYANRLVQAGVTREVQVVREAASQVSSEFRNIHPEIACDEIIGMRHRLVHDYRRINLDIVWTTTQQDLPKLIKTLEPLVPPPEGHPLTSPS